MRNRAKCKLCGDVLESFHRTDWVKCSCDEISICGGDIRYECAAKHWSNFLRVDDEDREYPVSIQNAEAPIDPKTDLPLITRAEKIAMLRDQVESVKTLHKGALDQLVSTYELWTFAEIVLSIFESE